MIAKKISQNATATTTHTSLKPTPDISLRSNSDISSKITPDQLKLFASTFRGRVDVFSRRASRPDRKTGKIGYYAQIDYSSNGRRYLPLTYRDLLAHLEGQREDCSDVIGVYPLLPDETCNFLVFDFDNHQAGDTDASIKKEVLAIREMCESQNIPHLVERSRSGTGYHLWLLFEEPVSAVLARKFGTLLLLKGSETVNLPSFKTFDRMIPTSDHLPISRKTGRPGIGNMVALPLQGRAVLSSNSVFIDQNFEAYPDQWQTLTDTKRLSLDLIEQKVSEWSRTQNTFEDDAPWEKKDQRFHAEDVDGELGIVFADRLYLDSKNLRPRLQNQLRRLAAFSNPEFYKRQGLGFSTYNIPRIIYCGEDRENYICLPRGLLDILAKELDYADISYHLEDKREEGRKIKVQFQGELYPEQKLAASDLLKYDQGILSASTAFGKTVLGAYLIAKRKVNTLILVHNYEILKKWQKDLSNFLKINEPLPEKLTPKGRKKKLKSIIGTLKAASDQTTGVIDIAMISSLGKPGAVNELVKNYGMVIMDECHHGPARISDGVLSEVNAKYFYGLTATPVRGDGLEKKIFFSFGPIRHKFSAKNRAEKTGFNYQVRIKTTDFETDKTEIYEIYQELINDDARNTVLINDAIQSVDAGKTPIVVTKFRKHAELLRDAIQKEVKNTFLLLGGDNTKTLEEIEKIPESEPLVLVATGQYIGEGFNLPRLDTLILTVPVSSSTNVEQYAGRINRDYPGKSEVMIYDYYDERVPKLRGMYRRRLATYRKIGYNIESIPAENNAYAK